MNESKKSIEPWQLIMILLLVIAFFGGLYVVTQTITSQLESIAGSVDAKTDTLKMSIDALGAKVDRLREARHAAATAPAPAPAPAPADGEPAAGDAQPAAEAAAAE